MFFRTLLQKNKVLNLRSDYRLQRYLNQTKLIDQVGQETVLTPLHKKKPQRDSFFKSLLIGNIDGDMFAFPEQGSDRHKDFIKWLKPIETYMLSCRKNQTLSKEEVLSHLTELEVFRSNISTQHFGLGLSKTELMRLTEVLTLLPWVGVFFMKNYVLPVELLYKYGSESQIHKYIPKIMAGKIVSTVCLFEGDNRTNINHIQSSALSEKDTWLLNGNKAFVVNGIDSHLFFVFARNGTETYLTKPESFSLFIVEKDYGGVFVEDVYDMIGRHDTPFCKVAFKDTLIPANNVIGTPGEALNILLEYLKPGYQNVSAQAISILRNFTNQLIEDVLKMKHFDRPLYEFDITKRIIGEIVVSLYTMESMTYLTNGMIDNYDDIDVDLERCITESYCANKCLTCIQAGLQLIGAPSCMENKLYLQALHDSLALTTMDSNNLDAKTYISMIYLQYIGKIHSQHVFKLRNPQQHPLYNFIQSFISNTQIQMPGTLQIHPSLELGTKHLEKCLNLTLESVMELLSQNGSEITQKSSDLHKISDMLTELYAMYANLSRASRSYMIGVRNSNLEKDISLISSILGYDKIFLLKNNLNRSHVYNGDDCYQQALSFAYEKIKYPLEHPLTRTF